MPRVKYKRQKDGRYQAKVELKRNDDGSRNRVTVYGKTVSELETKIRELKNAVENKTYVSKKDVTFQQYAEEFIETKKLTARYRTTEMYESIIRNYTDTIARMKINDITRQDIQQIINANASKARTCQKIRICFGAIFKQAVIDSMVAKNPMIGIKTPAYTPEEKRALSDDEKILLNQTEFTPKQKTFLILIQNYGLRKEEALALHDDSFNWKTNEMKINRACVFKNSRPTEEPTKNHETRTLKLFPSDADLIRSFIETGDFTEDPHLFKNQDGRWISAIGFRRMWESIINRMNEQADEMNIPRPQNLTCHVFRHSFATDCYYAGIPILETQRLTGHKSLTVLTQIYTHLDNAKRDPRDMLLAYRALQKEEQDRMIAEYEKGSQLKS